MEEAVIASAVKTLETIIPGIDATRYLSVAGFIILLYDHLLLLSVEIDVVWTAKWSFSKGLFLINRYTLPIIFCINAHVISGISSAGLTTTFCRIWLPLAACLGIASLAIANYFVAQRVWILWARNVIVKRFLVIAFVLVYTATYAAIGFVFSRTETTIQFSPDLKICALSEKQPLLVIIYCVPIVVDVFIFVLMCYNAFDRPRHLESWLIKQLITDGIVYFVCLFSLRLFNIIVIASQPVQFTQLGVYFIWTTITALVNRMLLTREFTDREWDNFGRDAFDFNYLHSNEIQIHFDIITSKPSFPALDDSERRKSHLRW